MVFGTDYVNGARSQLRLGSSTHGIFINQNPSGAQFCVSNWAGTDGKIICEIAGAANQSGDYLNLSSGGAWSSHGDILAVKANGQMDLGGPLKLKSYTLATLPDASTSGAGAMAFVSDEIGGAIPAFSDGSDWRRVNDRGIVS